MLVFGIIMERAGNGAAPLLIVMGAVFLLAAVLYYRSSRKVRLDEQESAT